jgi:chorismate-pyruvate lyase
MKPATAQAPADVDLLYPLSLFCGNAGHPLPTYESIDGAAVPEPYRGLLVHRGDMTSRLEAFHRGSIVLEVLHREHTADAYRREVVLQIDSSGLPVEYGAIEICLDAFPAEVRKLIVEAHLPLGGLMNRYHVKYRSEPRAFIQLGPDQFMRRIFQTPTAHRFFGRSNVLLGAQGETLARIVEVLCPADPRA